MSDKIKCNKCNKCLGYAKYPWDARDIIIYYCSKCNKSEEENND